MHPGPGQLHMMRGFTSDSSVTKQAVLIGPPAGEAPPHILFAEHVPQLALLPHMSAVVCHGGHNTVCEAFAHGVPLVVTPIRDDQPIIARQVADAGAGYGCTSPGCGPPRCAMRSVRCSAILPTGMPLAGCGTRSRRPGAPGPQLIIWKSCYNRITCSWARPVLLHPLNRAA